MKVALENFYDLKADHKIVILGDMFELGDASLEEHQQIVNMATQMNFNGYYFVGEHFYQTKENENLFKTFDDFKNDFENNIPSNSSILIKGSRGMRLERVVELLK